MVLSSTRKSVVAESRNFLTTERTRGATERTSWSYQAHERASWLRAEILPRKEQTWCHGKNIVVLSSTRKIASWLRVKREDYHGNSMKTEKKEMGRASWYHEEHHGHRRGEGTSSGGWSRRDGSALRFWIIFPQVFPTTERRKAFETNPLNIFAHGAHFSFHDMDRATGSGVHGVSRRHCHALKGPF